jgi:hypothetical protein
MADPLVGMAKGGPRHQRSLVISAGEYFSDIQRGWRQLFICLTEGPGRSSILVCLAAKFLGG